ncbi:MAG: hypothetical protein ACRC9L_06750 [Brevinema sp.]
MGLKDRLIEQKKIVAHKAMLYSQISSQDKKIGFSQKLKISRNVIYSSK